MGPRSALPGEFFVDDGSAEPRAITEGPVKRRPGGVRPSWRSLSRPRNVVVIGLVGAYVVWFIHLNFLLYYSYGEPPFDLSVFDQGMWLISHFRDPFVTIMGRNLVGDHTSFVLYLFAPLYRLFPEPQGLLVLQTLLLASPAVPIYLLARQYIRSTLIAMALVATYLLSPLIQQANLDQFHPECFQVLFISLAIYAAIESRSVLLVVMAVLCLTVKEDAALLVVPLGMWVALRRDRWLGVSIVVGAVAYAMIANWLIIPSILGTSSFYGSYIPFGGVSGLISTLFHHPDQLWSYLVSQGRPFYLWQLGATVGFTFIFSPEIAGIGIFVVAENVISNFGYMHQILYQYSMTLAPILVLGALYAIAQQSSVWRRNALAVLTLSGAIWTCALWGYAPLADNSVQTNTLPPNSIGALNYLEKYLPPNAAVSAWYPLDAHIDNRAQIYVWPTPFYAEDWGRGNDTGARLPVANQVRYLLLPIPLIAGEDPNVFQKIASDFRLVRSRGGYGLYEKNISP